MKIRWPVLILLAVVIAALFLPAAGVYVHSRLGEEAAGAFPESISLWDVAVKGNHCLPTDTHPALALPNLGRTWLICGLLVTIAAILATAFMKRGAKTPLLLTALAAVLYGTFLIQWNNVCGSLLFTILLKAQGWIYLPLIVLVILLVYSLISVLRHGEIEQNDRSLRLISGAFAVAALLAMLLPVYSIQVPDTVTDNAADAASIRRNTSLYSVMLGQEDNLYATGQKDGTFQHVLSGDLLELEPFSSDANNIQGIFVIRGSNNALNGPCC